MSNYGFMNTTGQQARYVPVHQKFNNNTGQTVARIGGVQATPLTYTEDEFITLAGILYYARKFTDAAGLPINHYLVNNEIRTSLQIRDLAGVLAAHPREAEILDSIHSVNNAVTTNRLKDYAKNAFQSNDNFYR